MMAAKGNGSGKSSSWPPIKPKSNLLPTKFKGSLLFTVPDFLTASECEAFIKCAESHGFAHQGSLGPARGEAFRDNDRISVHDTILAEKLWKAGLCNLFLDIKVQGKAAVGLNPNIRFYKYKVGQHFGQHIDESVDLGGGNTTEYTLLIYLSGGASTEGKNAGTKHSSAEQPLVGGETVFYAPRKGIVAEVVPTRGMALFHIHGDQCMLHEARVVSKGVKYVLRSDVIFERGNCCLKGPKTVRSLISRIAYTILISMEAKSSSHQRCNTMGAES